MSSEGLQHSATATPSHDSIRLSRWINERAPALESLLTAHDVARLVRRPSWTLPTLTLIGRLPARVQFHGRPVGWRRIDIEQWLQGRRGCRHRNRHARATGPCRRRAPCSGFTPPGVRGSQSRLKRFWAYLR